MKRLAGLLAFAAALVGAILLTQYYSRRYAPPPPPPPPAPLAAPAPPVTGTAVVRTQPPAGSYTDSRGNAPVSFRVQLATLNPAAGKASLEFTLERDPARPAPASVWVWAYFFSPDAPGRYCAGEPQELRRPFASGSGHDNVNLRGLSVSGCPAPKSPSSTYYVRVNVSTESAFAARLAEQRISYDITQASPVMLEGKQR